MPRPLKAACKKAVIMFYALSIAFGSLVGIALGLTGGGGSLLTVPLLVYGLDIPPKEAVGISLAAVGATSLIGLFMRIKSGNVEFATGFLFAAAGMLGAPAGALAAHNIPGPVLLVMFALLMVLIAVHMWRTASRTEASRAAYHGLLSGKPTCERSESGRLLLTTPCALLLLLTGLGTGVLSGLLGVGGGVIIVPALVMFSRMSIERAVGTSLLVVFLVSVSGTLSHVYAHENFSLKVTALFIAGGVLGLVASCRLRLSGPPLQKAFAMGIVLLAAFMLVNQIARSL